VSRIFNPHPSQAKLGRYKPIALELDKAGLGKYRRLKDNPIYYYNALTHLGGSLYRAALGYEAVWDRRAEQNLVLCLDYLLAKYREEDSYYLEEISVKGPIRLYGLIWPRGIAPKTYAFDLQWPFELKDGENLQVRVNLLDKPNHVDLERENGEVFSIQFMRYQNYLNSGAFKRKGPYNVNRSKSTKSSTNAHQGRKRKSLSLVSQLINEDAPQALSVRMHRMRQG